MRSPDRRSCLLQLMALVGASLVGACDRTAYTMKGPQFQERAADVMDWDRAAGRLAQTMQNQGYFAIAPDQLTRPTFYVHSTTPGSTFLAEVGRALEAEIMKRGGSVVRSPTGAVTVNLEVDLINWTGDLPWSTVAEASWGATILGRGSIDLRYRDRFYLRAGDAPLYASAMTVAPIGPKTVPYGPVRQVRLVQ